MKHPQYRFVNASSYAYLSLRRRQAIASPVRSQDSTPGPIARPRLMLTDNLLASAASKLKVSTVDPLSYAATALANKWRALSADSLHCQEDLGCVIKLPIRLLWRWSHDVTHTAANHWGVRKLQTESRLTACLHPAAARATRGTMWASRASRHAARWRGARGFAGAAAEAAAKSSAKPNPQSGGPIGWKALAVFCGVGTGGLAYYSIEKERRIAGLFHALSACNIALRSSLASSILQRF